MVRHVFFFFFFGSQLIDCHFILAALASSVMSCSTVKPDSILSILAPVNPHPTTSNHLALLLVHFTSALSTMPPTRNAASKSKAPVDTSAARPRGRPPKPKDVKSKQFIDDEAEDNV